MDVKFEQKVREKAYEIWMSAGMADGMAHDHWVAAEQVVMNETVAPAKKAVAGSKKPAEPKVAAAKKQPAAKAAKAAKSVKH